MTDKSRTQRSVEEAKEHSARFGEAVRRALLAAYDGGHRQLPWRGETDPYRIWVSEVMLQQTRVDTVIPYFERWLGKFPDIHVLAGAEEDEVLRAWQGLGYYSRARRLHQGAQLVRDRFGGALPPKRSDLLALPGVGEYTAGAVASIAFGEVVPAVDGNVRRVLARLFDLPDPSPPVLQSFASSLVDPHRPGDFNQALMELGALVCTPRSPRCEECALASVCLALEKGTVADRPPRRARKPIPSVEVVVVVALARDEDGRRCLLLRKRSDTGLLAGMWEFPGVEVEGASGDSPDVLFREAAACLADDLGLLPASDPAPSAPRLSKMDAVTHVFSHLRVRYRPFLIRSSLPWSLKRNPAEPQWIFRECLEEIPLPVAQQKIVRAVSAYEGD